MTNGFQGGEFYSDKINLVLTQIGLRLRTLFLIHCEEINEAAIVSLTNHCPNIETLGLYNCDFNEMTVENSEDEFYFRHRDKEKLQLLLDLKHLSIVSECPPRYAVMLLTSALNIETFKTGINCPLTDDDILQVFDKNQMKHLESFNIPASQHLTMKSVEILMLYCDKIRYDFKIFRLNSSVFSRSIQDLNYWDKCSEKEVERLRFHAMMKNYDLDLGHKPEERAVQKHLDDLNEDVVNYLRGITE